MSLDSFVLDAPLIDRVFQPLSEKLSWFGTCFDLARACGFAILFSVLLGGVVLYRVPLSLTAGPLVLVTVLVVGCLWGLRRFERRIRPGLMNPLRRALMTARLMYVFYAVRDALGFAPNISHTGAALWTTMDALGLLAFYFASCTPMPPVARSMSVPSRAALETS